MRALIDEYVPVISPSIKQRKRKPSSWRRKRIGCYSSVGAIALSDGRSREALFLKQRRRELIDFVGGGPSPAQLLLINDLVYLALRIEKDNERLMRGEYLSDSGHDRYLANVNAKRRGLVALLGLKGTDKPQPTLTDLLRGEAA